MGYKKNTMRKHLRKQINKINKHIAKWKFINKINIKNDEWFFILPFGIGDFYICLSLLDVFRKTHNTDKITIGIVKPFQRQILDYFDCEFYRYVFISNEELEFCKSNIFKTGEPIILHPIYFMKNSLLSIIGYKNINLNDIYKILLNIPISTINTTPKFNEKLSNIAKKRFNEYGLANSKNVLLAPNANSFDEGFFNDKYWDEVIDFLLEKGFKVLLNDNKNNIRSLSNKNIVNVNFPLNESIDFINLCDLFISVRSGLCDLVSSVNTKKIIIYPKLPWYSGNYITGCSLIEMGLSQIDIFEIEIDKNDSNNTINLLQTIL